MIRTASLRYAYKHSEDQNLVFPDIHLSSKESLLILGASGVGKTTLLHLLAGLLPIDTGDVYIGNTHINRLTRGELNHFRGQNIGLIFQKSYFIKSLSVLENLLIREKFSKSKSDRYRREELLMHLGLCDQMHKKVYQLSEGQQQRLSIALGVIHKPKIILADEPTSNLDDINCEIVVSLLKKEAKICNSNLVIITHDQRVKPHFNNHIIL
ncbi:ATP-binding cassette domain-containing protein [uncultured Aquimarina sp.]|uniref:ABC transporter ATP-binding protein n=1 Tax=uncultured Aquimarina sp. TaxID=575652 RepID=UPI00260D68E8|nr:ATP-binding cassette domain-containing protein [uncultured Aquimarina sp.]